MRKFYRTSAAGLFALVLGAAGCQPAGTNTNTSVAVSNANTGGANVSSNSSVNAANAGNTVNNPASAATVETREPEQYQAVMSLKVESLGAGDGQQMMNLPPITAKIARDGANRRVEFTLPNGESMIYLERGAQQFIITPRQGQYAELNKESVGMELQKLMSPAQMVERAKAMKGVERGGEEQFNGRTAIRYSYKGAADTKSQAGTVQTQSVALIDKETGLPLKTETVSESQTGDVKGVKGLKLVTEISELKTGVDAALFDEPKDLKKVAPEAVRGQVNLIMSAAGQIVGQLLQNGAPKTNNAPAMSPTP